MKYPNGLSCTEAQRLIDECDNKIHHLRRKFKDNYALDKPLLRRDTDGMQKSNLNSQLQPIPSDALIWFYASLTGLIILLSLVCLVWGYISFYHWASSLIS